MMSTYATKVAFLMMASAAIISGCFQTSDAFMIAPISSTSRQLTRHGILLHSSEKSATSSTNINAINSNSNTIHDSITINDKIAIRDAAPDERSKGGVHVIASSSENDIKALEVLARIPRHLIIASSDALASPRVVEAVSSARNITWATELTAATLAVLHPTTENEEGDATNNQQAIIKKDWIQSWQTGGWGNSDDLGPDISADVVGASLLTTGSDNDFNIYAKFRMPCHPAVFKASMGLEFLTNNCDAADNTNEGDEAARLALTARGFTYRSMRDALQELVVESTTRAIKGTVRDKRCWDVADTFDRVLSRATTIQLDDADGDDIVTHAIVPIHERLAHSLNENTKLVSIGDEVLIVATRDIEAGEPITRDYTKAPRMANDPSVVGSPLHLLLQFGLPPSAWPSTSE